MAFSVVVYLALRWNQFQMSRLIRTIVQDATHYFLVIFTSHLVSELTLIFASVRMFSYHSMLSFSLSETSIAYDPITPFHVSDTKVHLLTCSLGHFLRNSGIVVYVSASSICFQGDEVRTSCQVSSGDDLAVNALAQKSHRTRRRMDLRGANHAICRTSMRCCDK